MENYVFKQQSADKKTNENLKKFIVRKALSQ